MLRLVAVRELDVAEVNVERRPRLHDGVGRSKRGGERLDVGERAVTRGVHVGEIEHRADPSVESARDLDHVVGRAEVAHAAHDLDAEGHQSVLALESVAQETELPNNRVNCVRALASEQEPGVDHD